MSGPHPGRLWARAASLGLALAVLCLASCSDEGVTDGASDAGSAAAVATPTASGAAASESLSATEKLKAYYDDARGSKEDSAPRAPDESIVRCRLPAGDQYLRRYDCDLRGGSSAS